MEYLHQEPVRPDQPADSDRPDRSQPSYPRRDNAPDGAQSPYPRGSAEPRHHKKTSHPHAGGARLVAYFLTSAVCNALLAFYALYAYAQCVELSNDILASGQHATPAETIFQALLLLSPIFLTVLINRLLYRVMRGRYRRFARGVVPVACIFVVLVQVVILLLLVRSVGPSGSGGLNLDTISTLLPNG